MLADDAAYCNVCNTEQTAGFEEFEPKQPQNDTFLKVLCILTIVGGGFSILSAAFTLIMGSPSALPIENLEVITLTSCAISIGKLVGAIFMLKKKLNGLYIYTVAAILAMAMQIYSVFLTSGYMEKMSGEVGGAGGIIVIISAALSMVILVGFLVMYWLPVNKKLLS
jgi:hypothetical protein